MKILILIFISILSTSIIANSDDVIIRKCLDTAQQKFKKIASNENNICYLVPDSFSVTQIEDQLSKKILTYSAVFFCAFSGYKEVETDVQYFNETCYE
ncbi:MAG: hypothetical protein K2Q18_13905 [Bdellovibrionales bacterium]|nr:hypothetical protein [Bdellovibrionales bacterium]